MYKTKKNDFLDTIIILMMLSYILIQTWAHFARSLSENIILLLIILRLFFNVKINIRKQSLTFIFLSIVLMTIIFLNIITSDRTYLYENIKFLLLPSFTVVYFIYLTRNSVDFLKSFYGCLVIPLNIYLLINSVVMLIQTTGNYFLMDTQTTNTLYADLITGFIGADGTHRVTLFTICVLLLNLLSSFMYSMKKNKAIWIMFTISIFISIYVSTKNDNKSFYLFVPIFAVCTYLLVIDINFRNVARNTFKILLGAVFAIILFTILSKTPIISSVINRISNMIKFLYDNSSFKEYQIDERLLLLKYAVENGGIWGNGLGQIKMFADKNITTFFGTHFGMASAQNFVYFFGVVPYLLLLLVLAIGFNISENKKNAFVYFILMLAVSFYTQIFTTFGLTALFCIALSIMTVIETQNKLNRCNVQQV